jgi:hypothetical protein
MKIKTSVEVPIRRVQDMLCCAFEGGSNYWYRIEKFHEPKAFVNQFDEPFNTEKTKIFRHIDYPTNPGGYLIVSDGGEESGDDVKKVKLDLEACERGLQVMAEKYPRHFSNMLQDNDDAETGDVFLQCCLFGELVYG